MYLSALERMSFLGCLSWPPAFLSNWCLPSLVVAFSVSSRNIYFSVLVCISSGDSGGLLDSEVLNGPGRNPFSNVRIAAWVCSSLTSKVSALYHSRKSRSESFWCWCKPRSLETGLGLNLLVVKCAKNIEAKSENQLIDLGRRELNYLRVAFFNVIGKARHLTRSKTPASTILDLKASICSGGQYFRHMVPCRMGAWNPWEAEFT